MRTIYKYELAAGLGTKLELPKNARFLSIQTQGQSPQMWFEVQTEREKEYRQFYVFGTGHQIPDDLKLDYLGTFQLAGGALVFHAFEESRTKEFAA